MKLLLILVVLCSANVLQAQRSNSSTLEDLVILGGGLLDDLEDILKEVGMTTDELTGEVLENVRNVTTQLVKTSLNVANTFKVRLNRNVFKPFGRGIRKLVNLTRSFSRKKYQYDYINYVKLGKVTPVKDQGQCGSCYAFAGVAAMESTYLIAGRQAKNFSEQQIIDCSWGLYNTSSDILNNGCESGLPSLVMEYFKEFEVESMEEYPYEAELDTCKAEGAPSDLDFNIESVAVDNEDHLALLLNKYGPIIVYIHAGLTFQYYAGGVYNDFIFSMGDLDHAVLVVGIDRTWYGQEYWLIKNSWGTEWGEDGYIRFAKGGNIASMISTNVTFATTKNYVPE